MRRSGEWPAPIAAQAAGALDAAARQEVLPELARRLDAKHIDPAMGARVATFLRERLAANAYATLANPEAFAEELTRDLQRLSHDQQLNPFWSPSPSRHCSGPRLLQSRSSR